MDIGAVAGAAAMLDRPITGSLAPQAAQGERPARLSPVEWCALAIAVLVAHAFLVHEWRYPSSWDAGQYAQMGREIVANGLFHPFQGSDLRTYGYPLFLSVVQRVANASAVPFAVVLFAAQLALYAGACLLLRAALFRVFPRAARIAFCATIANGYVLIYLPESLTESLSATLVVAVAVCWLRAYGERASFAPLAAGSLAAGFAVMVRPGNLFLAAAWLFGLLVIALRRRPAAATLAACTALAAAALALPAIPQLVNNVAFHGKRTPLVVQNLGSMQAVWGIRDIKYATGMPPVSEAAIHYVNPLWGETPIDEKTPWRWYVDNGWRGPATLALHAFNLTDQDLLFTYSRDLDPWYRLPLGIVNHAAVALGLAGLWLLARSARGESRDALTVLFVLIAANVATYVTAAVEMRFGSILLLILAPAACHAAMRIAGTSRSRTRLLAIAGIVAYMAGALALSGWVRDQSPAIRAAIAAKRG